MSNGVTEDEGRDAGGDGHRHGQEQDHGVADEPAAHLFLASEQRQSKNGHDDAERPTHDEQGRRDDEQRTCKRHQMQQKNPQHDASGRHQQHPQSQ